MFLCLDGADWRRIRHVVSDGRGHIEVCGKEKIKKQKDPEIRVRRETQWDPNCRSARRLFRQCLATELPADSKERIEYRGKFGGFRVVVCLDHLLWESEWGKDFVEIEITLPPGEHYRIEAAKRAIKDLFVALLKKSRKAIPISYRTMLLEANTKRSAPKRKAA
jgi:adenylate cyclase class IV